MGTNYHLCLDVRGFLMNAKKRDYKGMFRHDDGRPMSQEEAKRGLLDELAKGHVKIPMAPCDNFDWEHGCLGHPAVEAAAEIAVQSSREMTKEKT